MNMYLNTLNVRTRVYTNIIYNLIVCIHNVRMLVDVMELTCDGK